MSAGTVHLKSQCHVKQMSHQNSGSTNNGMKKKKKVQVAQGFYFYMSGYYYNGILLKQ